MPRDHKNEADRPRRRWLRRWFGAIQPATRPPVIPIEKYRASARATRIEPPEPVPPSAALRRAS